MNRILFNTILWLNSISSNPKDYVLWKNTHLWQHDSCLWINFINPKEIDSSKYSILYIRLQPMHSIYKLKLTKRGAVSGTKAPVLFTSVTRISLHWTQRLNICQKTLDFGCLLGPFLTHAIHFPSFAWWNTCCLSLWMMLVGEGNFHLEHIWRFQVSSLIRFTWRVTC